MKAANHRMHFANAGRDLGEYDRYALYEHIKPFTASPPNVLRVDEKNLREYSVLLHGRDHHDRRTRKAAAQE